MPKYEDRFHYEDSRDNFITVFKDDSGNLSVSVSEELAVDSYNARMECSIYLKSKEAISLRDYLNSKFPTDKR